MSRLVHVQTSLGSSYLIACPPLSPSQDAAGGRSLVFDLSITHDRIGSSCHVQQNGLLSHPQDLDAPLRLAAQRKVTVAIDNNTLTIRTFLFSPPL